MKTGLAIFALLGTLIFAPGAWANGGYHGHGGHTSVGVVIGPVWGPWYYPPRPYYPPYPYYGPYPYYPPVVIESRPPPVYIEQAPAQTAPVAPAAPVMSAPSQYWYYCAASRGYYPYVKECPAGWQKVVPTPPGE